MDVGLHSRKTAVKIVDHIAKDIKNEILTKIIEQNLKICVIMNEASTISNKPVLIIFLKIEDCDKLEGQGIEQIYASLLKSLHEGGFDNEYLRNNLIAFCSDGGSVTLGCISGVGTRLKNDYPNIIFWHCLNHRLQLSLDDSTNDIKQVNHFKIFIDKSRQFFSYPTKTKCNSSKFQKCLANKF